MKKLIIIFLVVVTAIGCEEKKEEKVRYTQNSDEINTLKTLIRDYEKSDWDAFGKHYADTAKIYHNSDTPKSFEEITEGHKASLAALSTYEFDDEDDEFEMVLTDDDNTWVNYWGSWKGTLSEGNKEILVPVHLTARFVDGKIVEEHAYWDGSIMMKAMQEMDTSRVAKDSVATSQ